MIKWFKRNQAPEAEENQESTVENGVETMPETEELIQPASEVTKESIFARLKRGLSKTRHQLGDGIGRLLLGKKEISGDIDVSFS